MRLSVRFLPVAVCALLLGQSAWGWGSTGHRFVNGRGVLHLPSSMSQLASQEPFLISHASDADNRKSSDTAEYPKHFLDLELYPDYQNLPPDLSRLITQYGWPTVRTNGILPWAISWAADSLAAQFRRSDLAKAYQTAADLGHYVGDAHQPLHCTANYDGQLTGNGGIHSRYESQMINQYGSLLSVSVDTVRYVADPYALALDCIIASNALVDSILQADNAAKAASGWSGSGTAPSSYYAVLWERTRALTGRLMQQSTVVLASIWYTAWIDAGLTASDVPALASSLPGAISLEQNYPNPFNPSTVIVGQWSVASTVHLGVFDLLGREVAVLADGRYPPGQQRFTFDGRALPSGVYFARLRVGEHLAVRKMMLAK